MIDVILNLSELQYLWRYGIRSVLSMTIVAIAIGAALFGVLMNFGGIPIFTNTSLTTAMIIPVIVGSMFGPVPAFISCCVGNIIADLIGGWGFWFDWSVGNGVLGFIIGMLPLL